MKVLVADDDRVFVELLAGRLRAQHFAVLVAFDAMQAMQMAVRQQPDIIVLDIRMPGGSGLDTLRKLRTSSKTALVPVIVVTSLEDPSAEQTATALGAQAFIRKPASFDDVHSAIRSALDLGSNPGPE